MTQHTSGTLSGGYLERMPHTPSARQDRIERAILESLKAEGTRSELRALIIEYTDYLRLRGVPAERAIASVRTIGLRAAPYMNANAEVAVGDSASDRIGMMIRWASARYHRAD